MFRHILLDKRFFRRKGGSTHNLKKSIKLRIFKNPLQICEHSVYIFALLKNFLEKKDV